MNVYQFKPKPKPKPAPKRMPALGGQPWLPIALVLAGALILFLFGIGSGIAVGLVAALIVLVGAALNGGLPRR